MDFLTCNLMGSSVGKDFFFIGNGNCFCFDAVLFLHRKNFANKDLLSISRLMASKISHAENINCLLSDLILNQQWIYEILNVEQTLIKTDQQPR